MSHRQRAIRRLCVLFGAGALLALLVVAPAQADPFGELAHFGERGTALGQLEEPEYAFGVNPQDNSVYAVDEAQGGKLSPTEVRTYRR
jgi:hypothetical protein